MGGWAQGTLYNFACIRGSTARFFLLLEEWRHPPPSAQTPHGSKHALFQYYNSCIFASQGFLIRTLASEDATAEISSILYEQVEKES